MGLCPVFMLRVSPKGVQVSRKNSDVIPQVGVYLRWLGDLIGNYRCPGMAILTVVDSDHRHVDTGARAGDSGRVTELGKLIDAAARANNGRSMRAAADLATKRGAPISSSHISKNAREIDTVTPQLIRGIAMGYDLPEEEVARAVLADLGIIVPDYSPTPESAIRRDPNLSSEARAMLLAAIRAARSRPASRVVGDKLEDSRGVPATWLPDEDTGVGRDQDGQQRHQLGGS